MVTTVSVRRKVYSSRERLNIKDIINFKILDLNLHLSSLCRSIFFSSYLTSEGRRGAAGTGSASPSILIFNSPLKCLRFFIWFSNNWVLWNIWVSISAPDYHQSFQNRLLHKSISCATPWQPLQQVHEGSGRCWASRLLLQPEKNQF